MLLRTVCPHRQLAVEMGAQFAQPIGHANSHLVKIFHWCTYQCYAFPIFMDLFAKCINMDAGGNLVQSSCIRDFACYQNCNIQVL